MKVEKVVKTSMKVQCSKCDNPSSTLPNGYCACGGRITVISNE